MNLRPQPGQQEAFLSTKADIAIYGGGTRGGKTWALLMEPLRHLRNKRVTTTFFRKSYPDITIPGGAWDECQLMYGPLRPTFRKQPALKVEFPGGSRLQFAHCHNEADVYGYQGSQLPVLLIDEVTHFSEFAFWYLQSRNTGTCGIKPYTRCSCNPVTADDPVGGWVHDLVAWYLDDDGYADRSKSGVLRWFYRVDEKIEWFGSRDEAREAHPEMSEDGIEPTSFTFIPALLDDNPEQIRLDPHYRSRLMSLPLVEREQLLGGNWKIRATAGTRFNRAWFKVVEECPAKFVKVVRYFDKAGADETNKRGDYSAGCLMGYDGRYWWVVDMVHGKWSPFQRNDVILSTVQQDRSAYPNVELWIEQEPGNGGKESAMISRKDLAAFAPRIETPRTNKVARSSGLSAQMEAGNVMVANRSWTRSFIEELVNFPAEGWHDDQVDAATGAFNKLVMAPASGVFSITGGRG